MKGQDWVMLDLTPHFNNDGISSVHNVLDGDLDGEGMTFPAEALPQSRKVFYVEGVPLAFPPKEDGFLNNMSLQGQYIEVPQANYGRLHVLGVSESGNFEELVNLEYRTGPNVRTRIGLTDCRPALGRAQFGEHVAVRFDEMHFPPGDWHSCNVPAVCGIWLQTVHTDPSRVLRGIRWCDNPCMHVLAVTLARGAC